MRTTFPLDAARRPVTILPAISTPDGDSSLVMMHRFAYLRCCTLLLSTALAVLAAGCAATRPVRGERTAAAPSPDISLPPDSAAVDDSTLAESEEGHPAVALLADARRYLEEGDYPLTHRMLLSTLYAVDTLFSAEDDSLRTWLTEEVLSFYLEALPPAYLDSTPSEIGMLVLERQLNQVFDSLQLSTDDTLAQLFITCQKQTSYDVPVVYNDRVMAAFEFFITRRQGTIQRWFERIPYYLPVMQQMLVDEGLPADLAYLPLIESGFNPRAYSFAHASGIWQFIYGTGIRYRLRRSFWVDERRDPLKSTRAAIGYLRDLYEEFNDWYLVLAAYNCGEGRVRRTINRAGTRNYWELALPRETMHYVPKFIASLVIARNPACFGYELAEHDSLALTLASLDTVSINECIELATLERGLKLETGALASLNPHILQWCTPPDMDDVLLYLPPGTRATFDSLLAHLPEDEKVRWYRYRISSGDNLSSLAQRFSIPVQALKEVNKLQTTRIIAGRYLLVPLPAGRGSSPEVVSSPAHPSRETVAVPPPATAPAGHHAVTYRVKPGETLSQIAKVFHVSLSDLSAWNALSNMNRLKAGSTLTIYLKELPGAPGAHQSDSPPQGKRVHTVKHGDNLYSLAKVYRVSVGDLCRWNNLDCTNPVIYAGTTLYYHTPAPPPPSGHPDTPSPATSPADRGTIRYQVAAGDNLWSIARQFDVALAALLSLNDLERTATLQIGQILTVPAPPAALRPAERKRTGNHVIHYQVQSGDNLWTLSRRFGVPIEQLASLNNLERDATIRAGDTLRIVTVEKP